MFNENRREMKVNELKKQNLEKLKFRLAGKVAVALSILTCSRLKKKCETLIVLDSSSAMPEGAGTLISASAELAERLRKTDE